MKIRFLLPAGLAALLVVAPTYAHQNEEVFETPQLRLGLSEDEVEDITWRWAKMRADAHAPAGVMGDHTHKKGGKMFHGMYMSMPMKDFYQGSDRVSDGMILGDYMMVPVEMDMQMGMVGGMYSPIDGVTLTGMIPVMKMSMKTVNRMGKEFETESEGIGDVELGALIDLYKKDNHRVHLNLALSLPTGSIDEEDKTPMGTVRLPYPMQLGSGTVDLKPGVTYLYQDEDWSLGTQAIVTVRLGENDNDYTLGDRLEWTIWVAKEIVNHVSVSARVAGNHWEDIDGADPRLNPMMSPTTSTDVAGSRLDALIGLNFGPLPLDFPENLRAGIEYGQPIYRDYSGDPVMEPEHLLYLTLQFSF